MTVKLQVPFRVFTMEDLILLRDALKVLTQEAKPDCREDKIQLLKAVNEHIGREVLVKERKG